jgi:hypothetical protein
MKLATNLRIAGIMESHHIKFAKRGFRFKINNRVFHNNDIDELYCEIIRHLNIKCYKFNNK